MIFDNFKIKKRTLLLNLGQILDKVAKLGKSTQDSYNLGGWLILLYLLKNGVAEGVASDPHDTTVKIFCLYIVKKTREKVAECRIENT